MMGLLSLLPYNITEHELVYKFEYPSATHIIYMTDLKRHQTSSENDMYSAQWGIMTPNLTFSTSRKQKCYYIPNTRKPFSIRDKESVIFILLDSKLKEAVQGNKPPVEKLHI